MIPLNAVLYFTSDIRKIGAFFLNDEKEIWFYGKLDDLEKQLQPYGYLRCHQSYLVNGRKIEGIDRECVITSGGSIPISRKYSKNVKERWEDLKHILYNNAGIALLNENADGEAAESKETTLTGGSTTVVTKKYGVGTSKYGMIIEIQGENQSASYRIYDDEAIIGRDRKLSHIVVNNRMISRKHCGVKFSVLEQCYWVRDYSMNGTRVSGMGELPKNCWVSVKRDSLLQLVNGNFSFILL